MKRVVIQAVVAFAFLASFVVAGEPVKIAYVVKAMSDQFWIDMYNGAMETAKEMNVELSFQAPEKETDVEKQIQMVENAIISKVDAIILSASDSKALNPVIGQDSGDSRQRHH